MEKLRYARHSKGIAEQCNALQRLCMAKQGNGIAQNSKAKS